MRRLLINPLVARGFWFPKGVEPETGKKRLAEMADELIYMSDDRLRVLEECLRSKGDGSARCFWPARATVLGFAGRFQPRPIEELPAMASWFGSVEGPKARDAGMLVPTYLFIEREKRPPVRKGDLESVRVGAMWWSQVADDIRMAEDRKRRGFSRAGDADLLAWVTGIKTKAEALVKAGENKRDMSA